MEVRKLDYKVIKNMILALNWKLNPSSFKEADKLFNQTITYASKAKNLQVLILPPFQYLFNLNNFKLPFNVSLGAQNCFWENIGSYTGEVSPLYLKENGVDYALLGHSERRIYLKETPEMIKKKLLTALNANLKVILCIGENREIHLKGEKNIKAFLRFQINNSLKNFNSLPISLKHNLIIAYEPIWAISGFGGKSPEKPQIASNLSLFIKNYFKDKYGLNNELVLYGGSLNSKNITNFLDYETLDGFLIGKSSVNQEEVKELIEILKNKK